MTEEALYKLQEERESAALAAGRAKFLVDIERRAQGGEFALTQVGRELVRDWLEPLEDAIRKWKPAVRPGPKSEGEHVAHRWIEQAGPDVAAFITLVTVIDGLARVKDYRQVCLDVADQLRLELRSRRLEKDAPEWYELAASKPKREQPASFRKLFRFIDASDLDIPDEQQVKVGDVVVTLLADSTGMIENAVIPSDTPTTKKGKLIWLPRRILRAAPNVQNQLQERIRALAAHRPQNHPMVVRPLPWAPGERGGYRFALRGENPLIRHGLKVKGATDWDRLVEQAAMPTVYEALNALQNTAWRINRPVYDLVEHILERGGDIAGLPKTALDPEPARPKSKKRESAWKRTLREVREANARRKERIELVERVRGSARTLLEHTFWFPYNLDFRGRVYPIPDGLQPQGNDLAKGLLTFEQGRVLDETGERWLANHGAKRLGQTPKGAKMSRMTLDERVEWVRSNTTLLVSVADDPFGNLWWANTEAVDHPLQFYAFCVEWRDMVRTKERGEAFVSTLPVSIDGSCNGLQHYSSMFRDEQGGAHVNLVVWKGRLSEVGDQGAHLQNVRPEDMYELVAEKVQELVPKKAQEWLEKQQKRKEKRKRTDDPIRLAAKILETQLVTRSLVKRPTMSFFYSAKQLANQMREELAEKEGWERVVRDFGSKKEAFAALQLIDECVKDAIEATAVKAFEAMGWLRMCARAIVANGRDPEWQLPSGFGVRQVYQEVVEKKVRTSFGGDKRIKLNKPADERDARKHEQAIAPNVIHSLDAAALAFTLARAADNGVVSLAAAHDCYTTVAADCALLAQSAGQAFSRVYTTHDPEAPPVRRGERSVMLESLYRQFQAQADGADVTPPSSGTLDLNVWLASENLFS